MANDITHRLHRFKCKNMINDAKFVLPVFFAWAIWSGCGAPDEDSVEETVAVTIFNIPYSPSDLEGYIYWAPKEKVAPEFIVRLSQLFKTVTIENNTSDTLLLFISNHDIIDVRQVSYVDGFAFGHFDDGWLPGTLDTLMPHAKFTGGIFWEFWRLDSAHQNSLADSSLLYFEFWKGNKPISKKYMTIELKIVPDTFFESESISSVHGLKVKGLRREHE